MSTLPTDPIPHGATVIVTHHVRHSKEKEYLAWLEEISSVSRIYPGFLDKQVIKPISGMTCVYTIVIRFDTQENLLGWVNSRERKALHEKAKPFLSKDINTVVRSGLDFWFSPKDTRPPKRWKQVVVTCSALVPLNILASVALLPLLKCLGAAENFILRVPIVTCLVVVLMTYVVMPYYTKVIGKWLYEGN